MMNISVIYQCYGINGKGFDLDCDGETREPERSVQPARVEGGDKVKPTQPWGYNTNHSEECNGRY